MKRGHELRPRRPLFRRGTRGRATGGSSHYGFNIIRENSEVRENQTFGLLKFTLHNGSYGWEFVPEAGFSFTDSGSAACH